MRSATLQGPSWERGKSNVYFVPFALRFGVTGPRTIAMITHRDRCVLTERTVKFHFHLNEYDRKVAIEIDGENMHIDWGTGLGPKPIVNFGKGRFSGVLEREYDMSDVVDLDAYEDDEERNRYEDDDKPITVEIHGIIHSFRVMRDETGLEYKGYLRGVELI